MVISDERLKEIAESGCLCVDCEPDLVRDEVRPMAEELLRLRTMTDQPKPDTIDVPLFAEDFELIDRALHLLRQIDDLGTKETADAIAELRDRLKRSRLPP